MKKCPFCKKEIESNATECPICKMVLIEKIPSAQTSSNYSYNPPKKTTKENTYTHTTPNKSYSPKKEFKFPKIGNGWIISIVGSILLTVILNYHGAPNPLPAPIPTTTEDINQLSPPVSNTPYRYLTNGTVLFSDPFSFSGEGILSISNGGNSDAVVKLITNSGKKVYFVYVRANNSFSIKNINDGIYRVLFSFGADWDSDQKKFLVNPSAKAFDDTFDFNTTDTTTPEWEIFLKPILGGNARTNPIDPNVFDKY